MWFSIKLIYLHFVIIAMYRYLSLILVVLGTQMVSAQMHELGVFLGGSNPISDVGRTYYIYPNKLAYGGIYKWNFHDRVSLRFQVLFTDLRANDIQSDVNGKIQRQFAFSNQLSELALGIEYNFLKFSMHNRLAKPVTPYFSTGFAYINYDDIYIDKRLTLRPLEAQSTSKRDRSWAVPIILGVKAKVSVNFVVAAELGTRFTFTNNIDGSFPQRMELAFGNKNTNDWYTFSGITLTYTFGRKPCYCD